jgi:hypothetical protein
VSNTLFPEKYTRQGVGLRTRWIYNSSTVKFVNIKVLDVSQHSRPDDELGGAHGIDAPARIR